jgi:hypothetical protein
MVNDEPGNDNNQPGETVESITLASLLENPDPDFDVAIEMFSKDMPGRRELVTDINRPSPPKPEREQT